MEKLENQKIGERGVGGGCYEHICSMFNTPYFKRKRKENQRIRDSMKSREKIRILSEKITVHVMLPKPEENTIM